MYFVVYLLNPSVHVVIPKTWIQGIDSHWEKFINNSLNRNQTFLCFYSEERNSKDEQGYPDVNFAANFDIGMGIFPNEGCYFGRLIAYKGNNVVYFSSIEILVENNIS